MNNYQNPNSNPNSNDLIANNKADFNNANVDMVSYTNNNINNRNYLDFLETHRELQSNKEAKKDKDPSNNIFSTNNNAIPSLNNHYFEKLYESNRDEANKNAYANTYCEYQLNREPNYKKIYNTAHDLEKNNNNNNHNPDKDAELKSLIFQESKNSEQDQMVYYCSNKSNKLNKAQANFNQGEEASENIEYRKLFLQIKRENLCDKDSIKQEKAENESSIDSNINNLNTNTNKVNTNYEEVETSQINNNLKIEIDNLDEEIKILQSKLKTMIDSNKSNK